MSTTSCIRRHIDSLGTDDLFTTTDVLHCGTRPSVDQALYRLTKSREVVRWTSGVFSTASARRPSAEEVARAKTRARGDMLMIHSFAQDNKHPEFSITGSSSSFRFGTVRVYLKRASKRTP